MTARKPSSPWGEEPRAPEWSVGGMSTSSLRRHSIKGYLNSPDSWQPTPEPVTPGGPGTRVKLTCAMPGADDPMRCPCCDILLQHKFRHGRPTELFVLVNVTDQYGRWVRRETWVRDHYVAAGRPHGHEGEFRPPSNVLGDTNTTPSFVKNQLRKLDPAQ